MLCCTCHGQAPPHDRRCRMGHPAADIRPLGKAACRGSRVRARRACRCRPRRVGNPPILIVRSPMRSRRPCGREGLAGTRRRHQANSDQRELRAAEPSPATSSSALTAAPTVARLRRKRGAPAVSTSPRPVNVLRPASIRAPVSAPPRSAPGSCGQPAGLEALPQVGNPARPTR
jgi:hypothetical protein